MPDKQIIDLYGTRVDTLYTTVESGTNEDGTEYEKRQATAPRTFTTAIADENGVPLEEKLASIEKKIEDVVVGELPGGVVYVGAEEGEAPDEVLIDADRLQGYKAEDFAKKDELYQVPEGEGITYSELYRTQEKDGSYLIQKNIDGTWTNLLNIGMLEDKIDIFCNGVLRATSSKWTPDRPIQFLPSATAQAGIQQVATSTGMLLQTASANNAWTTLIDFISQYNKFEIYGTVDMRPGKSIRFRDTTTNERYKIDVDENNTLTICVAIGSSWINVLYITTDGAMHFFKPSHFNSDIDFVNNTSIVWRLTNGSAMFRLLCTTGNVLKIQVFPSGSWVDCVSITSNGGVSFTKNITAPNIASTAALMEAQQEITEKDIQLIKAEQEITEMDLRLAAIESKLQEVTNDGI